MRRITVLFIFFLLLLPLTLTSVAVADEGDVVAPQPQQQPQEQPQQQPQQQPPEAGAQTIVHGAHINPIFHNNTEIEAYDTLVGKDAGIVMIFSPWDIMFSDGLCGFYDMTYKHNPRPQYGDCAGKPRGPEQEDLTIMLTWQPIMNPTGEFFCPLVQNGRPDLQVIANGECDYYIRTFARKIKAWNAQYGDRFMLRYAHEMNISSNSPYSYWKNDPNYPATYRASFQRIVNIFRAEGVSRDAAMFVWSPNNRSNPPVAWNAIPNYYPGDEYVDWIGLSGFNWYTYQNQPWRTFEQTFNSPDPMLGNQGVLSWLHCTYAKPIVLAEFGSVEGPGGGQTKAAWIQEAYTRMQDFPYVRAAVWFNDYAFGYPNATDFRVTEGSAYASPNKEHYPGYQREMSVTATYRAAISDPNFIDYVPSMAELTPSSTYCGTFPPSAADIAVPSRVLMQEGATTNVLVQGLNVYGTFTVSVSGAPGGFGASLNPGQISTDSPNTILTIRAPGGTAGQAFDLTVQASGDGASTQKVIRVEVIGRMNNVYAPLTVVR